MAAKSEVAVKDMERTLSAEVSVLGGIFLAPEKLGEVILAVSEDDFINPACKELFRTAKKIFAEGGSPDVVAVVERAGKEYQELAVHCMSVTPSAASLMAHVKLLREKSRLIRLQIAAAKLAAAINLEEAEAAVAEINALTAEKPGIKTLSMTDLLMGFIKRQQAPKPKYIKWGLEFLDANLYIEKSGFVMLAGRPSAGKTALALNLVMNIAKERRVGFYSLETSEDILTDRFVAAETGTSFGKIKRHELAPEEQRYLGEAISSRQLSSRKFDYIGASGMTVADIRAHMLSHRYEVIVVDYVQLIRPSIKADRTEQVSEISRGLKEVANSCGVTVLGLVQLKRPDKSGKKESAPTMEDLKESGQLEQDADAIMMLYLEDPKNRKSDRILKIAKNKEGEANMFIRMAFNGDRQKFTSITDAVEPPHLPRYEPPKKKEWRDATGEEQLPLQFREGS